MVEKITATAVVPDTSFKVEVTGETLEKAHEAAYRAIDQKIDDAVGGLARGGEKGLEFNRKLKSAVVVTPPLLEKPETVK